LILVSVLVLLLVLVLVVGLTSRRLDVENCKRQNDANALYRFC
jgi:hypothetical protein